MTYARGVSETPVDVTALVREAAGKSGLLWLDVPGDRAWPAWHIWLDGAAYVVSGPGEQTLPTLPAELAVVFRSKDTGGRLISVHATATAVGPGDPAWDAATTALKASRLNAPGGVDIVARWAAECTVTALTPFGMPVESPGSYSDASGAAVPAPTPATTATWQPWHLNGRRRRRRG